MGLFVMSIKPQVGSMCTALSFWCKEKEGHDKFPVSPQFSKPFQTLAMGVDDLGVDKNIQACLYVSDIAKVEELGVSAFPRTQRGGRHA